MRVVEESFLKRTVLKLNNYALEHKTSSDFFKDIDSLEVEPLQDLSFQSDLKYFDEINFILSVISSIISHPHISTSGEHIVVRTELANTISNETFQMTMRDSQLWKDDGLGMVPESVYYYQSIDELCIYENIFVVMLIRMIEAELKKYSDFYVSLIETFEGQPILSLSGNNADIALNRIGKVFKKLKYIKDTRFYKEINRRGISLKTVHPTNILLKDRLYNYCFKFYRSIVTYSDKQVLLKDFRTYYYVLLLRALKKRGFAFHKPTTANEIKQDKDGCLILPNVDFSDNVFHLRVEPYEDLGLKVTVVNRLIGATPTGTAVHLLVFEPQENKDELMRICGVAGKNFQTVEAVHLWNLVCVDDELTVSFKNPMSEQALMEKWLDSKLLHSVASAEIYQTYCPSCKNQTLEDLPYSHKKCAICGSVYTFYHDEKGQNCLWFLKLRRQK